MAKTSVVSSRLYPDQEKRLARKARRLGRSPSELGAILIEEGLRRDEFAFIDFRTTPLGREAFVQGSTLAVWEVIWLFNIYERDAQKTADHLQMLPLKVRAAINYGDAFSDEIELALDGKKATDFKALKRLLPNVEEFIVPVDK